MIKDSSDFSTLLAKALMDTFIFVDIFLYSFVFFYIGKHLKDFYKYDVWKQNHNVCCLGKSIQSVCLM